MSGLTNTSTETLQTARRFNANGNQENSPEQTENIKENALLEGIIAELERTQTVSADNVAKLRKIFSSLSEFNGQEKYLYRVTISLGISHKPELVALAEEFNAVLTQRR